MTEYNKFTSRRSANRERLGKLSWEAVFNEIKNHHRKPRHVVEWFGGTGECSQYIEKILEPDSWKIYEIDLRCVSQLKMKFPQAEVTHADSYKSASVEGTVIVLDFDKWSVLQFEKIIPVLQGGAKWIVITDHAIQRIVANSKTYSKKLGMPVRDMKSYLVGFSFLVGEFGYYIHYCISHYAVSKIVLRKGKPKQATMEKLK